MDAYSSGEELIIKTRKPYTITKQRERWTEEEHNRFLEALKLYGRAWQRIEDHIGTKTAVQIRSHAQKFFSKLEKEALIKGIPLGQALDIEIPPPRPKRKPSNPYPRKTSTGDCQSSLVKDGKLLTPALHLNAGKQPLDLENDPLAEKSAQSEKSARARETLNEDNCSEVLTLFEEFPCTSFSSVSTNCIPESSALKNSSTFREFVPSLKDIDQGTTDESNLTVKTKVNQKLDRTGADYTDLNNDTIETLNSETSSPSSHDKPVQGVRTDGPKKHEILGLFSTEEMQTFPNFPKHAPLQFVDGISMQNLGPGMTYSESIMHQVGGAHANPNLLTNPTTSASNEHHNNMSRPSVQQPLPSFLPQFTPMCNNQETFDSFLNFSATFSTLLVSILLQNPAAHAAARLAASFLPCTNVETWVDSSSNTLRGLPPRQISPPPSMAAVAAATVAAASAWWAAHGLLPLCPLLLSSFNSVPSPPTTIPSTDTGQPTVVDKDKKDHTSQDPPWEDQQVDLEFCEAVKRDLASKSPPASSSDSESGGTRSNGNELKDHMQKPMAPGFHDSNKAKTRKQVDRSSCGSNTASSTEVETDALEKHEKGEEESKEIDISHASVETNNRRNRSASNINESWKEVSEEGRIAFQALFSREVLPQSFSSQNDLRSNEHRRAGAEEGNEKGEKDALQLNLISKTHSTCPDHPGVEKDESMRSSNSPEVGLLMTGLGHAKLKVCRTGFKPYKRCSLETKEEKVLNGSGHAEEKGAKRIRLEGGAST